jgi:hypothetical protein
LLIAQPYINGALSTGSTSNSAVAAPTGYTWSECQNETGNTTESNTNSGFSGYYNTAGTTSFQLADDFTVPTGQSWNVTGFDFYCYQTGYAGTTPPIDGLRVLIYNNDPSLLTSNIVAGNATTNVYDATNSNDALMYRIFNSAVPVVSATGTTRKLWKVRANLTGSLPSGTYWVVYQGHSTNDGTLFFPPVTISGVRGISGWNAKQNVATTNTWSSLIDAGNPATAPDFSQDMAFNVQYSVVLSNDKFANLNEFKISPNPVKSDFAIAIPESMIGVVKNINIYNLQGQEVKSSKVLDSYSMSDLSSGIYFVSVLDESKNVLYKSKIIKE